MIRAALHGGDFRKVAQAAPSFGADSSFQLVRQCSVIFSLIMPVICELIGWKQIDISAVEIVFRSWQADARVLGGVLADQCQQLFRNAVLLRAEPVSSNGCG